MKRREFVTLLGGAAIVAPLKAHAQAERMPRVAVLTPYAESDPASPNLFDGYLPTFLPLDKFPKTRYQGSKRRLLVPLQDIFAKFKPGTAVDLYSGTATVSLLLRLLLLRLMGWRVVANDYLLYNNATARLMFNGPPC